MNITTRNTKLLIEYQIGNDRRNNEFYQEDNDEHFGDEELRLITSPSIRHRKGATSTVLTKFLVTFNKGAFRSHPLGLLLIQKI